MYTHGVIDMYRSAASLLVLRPAGEGHDILLLHKPRKKDAWQLPQGGVEGNETIEECALRELKEEAGLSDVRILGKSGHVYQYNFPASYRRFRPDNICGQRIEFVFALTSKDAVITVDAKEVDKFMWVKIHEVPQYVRRKEYLDLVKKLYQEALHLV